MVTIGPISLDRMVQAVEDVQKRMLRAAAAMDALGVPYAVVGGNAVAIWVTRVKKSLVRYTQDVDILVNRSDLETVKRAMSAEGFVFAQVMGVDLFLDGPDCDPSDGVHLLYAGEKVRDNDPIENPLLVNLDGDSRVKTLPLDALVKMKLTSYRRKDQVHLDDLILVGLIDELWLDKLEPPLAERLKRLLDTRGE